MFYFDDIKQQKNKTMEANHKIIREFTCLLSGDKCLIILDFDTNEEVCILRSDYYFEPDPVCINTNWQDDLPEWEKGYFLV